MSGPGTDPGSGPGTDRATGVAGDAGGSRLDRVERMFVDTETRLCAATADVPDRTDRAGWSAPTAAVAAAIVVVIEPT